MEKFNKYLPYIILGALSIVTLIPFVFTGFSNFDDLSYYINARNADKWEIIKRAAVDHGRFYYYITMTLVYSIYFIDNYLVLKCLNIIFVLFDFILIALIAKEFFNNKWDGILCYLLMIVFVSVKGIYNPIVSYPLYFSGSFLFILLSVYFALRYKNTKLNNHRLLSALLFAIGLLFYETYLLYLSLIIVIIFITDNDVNYSFFQRLRKTIPFIIIGFTYCIIYFSYRLIYPSTYAGASFSNSFSIVNFFNTVLNFTSGSYPMALTFNGGGATYGGADYFTSNSIGNILYFIISENIEWLFKSIIISVFLFFTLNRITDNKHRGLFTGFLISLLFIFFPQIPLAFTEKYLSMGGIPSYTTTYFSVFAVIVCLTYMFIFISLKSKNFKYRNLLYIAISVIIGLASILNDYANYHAVKCLKVPLNVFQFVNEFLNKDELKSLPENSFIYAPELYDSRDDIVHFTNSFNWSIYFSIIPDRKPVFVSQSKAELIREMKNKTNNNYYINYKRDQYDMDQYIAFSTISNQSRIDSLREEFVSDSTIIFYYSNNKTFTLFFDVYPDSSYIPVIVNNDTLVVDKNKIELNIINKSITNNFMTIQIKSKNIDLNSIIISNLTKKDGISIALE